MDKKEFLEKLKKNISVLEEREIEDIISEYEQHIDMRIAKGLSEEEAIADFGDIDELCTQILEAYSVDSQDSAGNGTEPHPADEADDEPDYEKLKAEGKKAAKKAARQAKTVAGESAQRIGDFVRSNSSRLSEAVKRPFKKKRPERGTSDKESFENNETGGNLRSAGILAGVCNGIKGIFRICIDISVWCVKLAWNFFWIMTAFVSGIFALFSVFGLGLMAVLLFQGYPVAGIGLMSLGGALAFGAFTVLCTIFMVKMKRNRGGKAA